MVKPSKRGGRSLKTTSLCLTITRPALWRARQLKTGQLQRGPDDRRGGIPVFQMKEGEALAEDLGFVFRLDSEALPRMQSPEALFQFGQNILVHLAIPWSHACHCATCSDSAADRAFDRFHPVRIGLTPPARSFRD